MDLVLSQYFSRSGLLRKMRYWSGKAWPWTGKPKVRVEPGGIGQQSRCCAGLAPDFPGQGGPFSGAIATAMARPGRVGLDVTFSHSCDPAGPVFRDTTL